MKQLYLLAICYFSFLLSAQTQVQEVWSSCYQKNGNSTVENDMVVDDAGNSYVTGYYWDSSGKQRFFVGKTNKNGVQKWVKFYPTTYPDTSEVGTVITVDRSGNVIASGYRYDNYFFSCSTTVSHTSVFTVCFNANGNLKWVNFSSSILENTTQEPADILIDSNKNIYMLYNVFSYSGSMGVCGYQSSNLIKINSAGLTDWAIFLIIEFAPMKNFAMGIDKQNNILVTGIITPPPIHPLDIEVYQIYTQKIKAATGEQIWYKGFHNTTLYNYSTPYAIMCDSKNNIYVYGEINDTLGVLRYSSTGNLVGYKTDNAGAHPVTNRHGFTIDSNDNICILGYQYIASKYSWIIGKYASNGNKLWSTKFDTLGSNTRLPVAIKTDKEGNVFVTGNSNYQSNLSAFTTLKYSANGKLKWVNFYKNGQQSTNAVTAIALDSIGNIYVSGNSYNGNIGNNSVCTQKLTETNNQFISKTLKTSLSTKNKY